MTYFNTISTSLFSKHSREHSGEDKGGVKKFSTLPASFKSSTSPSHSAAKPAMNKQQAVRNLKYGPNAKVLRLLTWNIEGLNPDLVIERAMSVCDEIEERVADVVYLQEIIPSTWDAITHRLQDKYYFYRDETPRRYFHILMIRIDSDVEVEGDVQVMKFPNTTQSRHLLHIPVKFCHLQVHFLTSHLESLNKDAPERRNQLKTIFELMSSLTESQDKTCIFGGDMNITGKEVEQAGFPDNFGDMWEMCGSDMTKRCTWDSTEPRMRLDRLHMCPKDSPLQPDTFDLVGEALLVNYGVYPSDHLGVWTEFVLKDKDKQTNTTEQGSHELPKSSGHKADATQSLQ